MAHISALPIDRQPDILDRDMESYFRKFFPSTHREYRLNRFRIYFKMNGDNSLADRFGDDLFENFVSSLNQPAATVKISPKKFNNSPVLAFTGDLPGPGPNLHDDYVYRVQHDSKSGFTFQTAKRNFEDKNDRIIRLGVNAAFILGATSAAGLLLPRYLRHLAIVTGLRGKTAADVVADYLVGINQRHFLAGRRSWVIKPACDLEGDGSIPDSSDVYVLETAAIERASRPEFLPGVSYFDDQTKIIWPTQIRQYVELKGFEIVKHNAWSGSKGAGYVDGVSYLYSHMSHRSKCVSASSQMCLLHQHLWP